MKATKTDKGLCVLPVGSWRGDEEIYLVNPSERECMYPGRGGAYLFTFGAYRCTRLLVWARSVEDGLEDAAAWLADHAKGHLVHDDYLTELHNEARAELAEEGLEDDELEERAHEQATVDLTYTESGYLTSYEWWVDGPLNRRQLRDLLNLPPEPHSFQKPDPLAGRYPGNVKLRLKRRAA